MKKPEENSLTNELQKKGGVVPFVTEIARYFMEFLETDFHKVRSPKRQVQNRNKDNLQTGINLSKYKNYNSLVWKVITSGFTDESLHTLKRGSHTNAIPDTLIKLIEDQISLIDHNATIEVINQFQTELELAIYKNQNDTTATISTALESISRVIREKFLSPFIDKIREPLEKVKTSNVDSIYQIEEEVTDILMLPFEEVVTSIVNHINLKKDINSKQLLEQSFDTREVKMKLESFFKGFAVGDLFLEVSELFNNKNLLEKQEFYLYFCDITYHDHTYPIFYIPIQIAKTAQGFSFIFDSLLYVNKKAIQFVSQDYNADIDRKGSLQAFIERIIYLSEDGNRQQLIGDIDLALKEAINYFVLSPYLDVLNPEKQTAKSQTIKITNSCHFALFDKSDESLVNDYEDILSKLKEGNDELAIAFQVLIDDFIMDNPASIISDVENDWENHNTSDKLVYESPIPLNEEQRQILLAINKNECKYLTIEGPPGTGKSHTITAIVCDAILKNQSVLVLSDKKEALDVVEDKVTDTMNNVRLDNKFQNPILRLGQAGNTYAKILSSISMNRIKEHYKAVRSDYKGLESNIRNSIESLKKVVETSINAHEKINIYDVADFITLESKFSNTNELPVDLNEMSYESLTTLKTNVIELKKHIFNQKIKLDAIFRRCYRTDPSITGFKNFICLLDIIEQFKTVSNINIGILISLKSISSRGLIAIEKYIDECTTLKSEWFGYLFKGKKIKELNRVLSENVMHTFEKPHQELFKLRMIVSEFERAKRVKESKEISNGFQLKVDFIQCVHKFIVLNLPLPTADERESIIANLTEIEYLFRTCPITSEKMECDPNNFFSILENKLTRYSEDDFENLRRFLQLRYELDHNFNMIPIQNFATEKKAIEDLITTQMTYKMDERVVDFYQNNLNDAKSLSGVISKKQRFDRSSFEKLKKAFPCILAGIRDFSEYIPLESDIFDLIIIDEASQVSIAQAFPAILRGKKIIVLGDKRQFSNVKSAQARSETNREYLNLLRKVFVDTISDESMQLERLDKFNIKTSILEFFERISNFNIMLRKHFRGYLETISYSSKYFYENTLQSIKIRGKSINDVIRFSNIEHDGRMEPIENTNYLEIEAIIKEVERIHKEEYSSTIGIITPHTNQQKILIENFSNHPNIEIFQDQHKLKIMTFDTCQGEERDIIIYSMVASNISDKLWAIFIKDRSSADLEEGGKIKLQRLNVGFSRAKERMHFFLSKPIDNFTGSIGEALKHYQQILDTAINLPDENSTDPRSPMENKVLHWIQETKFFKLNSSAIELHAQFPLGEYIKQLDKTYTHPAYVADFLLIFTDDDKKMHNIIIEYDGFEFHFIDHALVNKFNYQEYYSDEHVYREKVLESYGYKFLRINRFNLGKDPIETLEARLSAIVKKKISNINM